MFNVDGFVIALSRGDTGAIKFTANTTHTFTADDRALFSVKNGVGEVVKQSAYPLDENKAFVVAFYNHDTDTLAAGTYTWDVRYIINPYYDTGGQIIDGDQVITPRQPMELQLLQVVGEV
jgi:hypothetical protein